MLHLIEFYFPKHEKIIPSKLRLRIDGELIITYEMLNDHTYEFSVPYTGKMYPEETEKEIINQIVNTISEQSYSNGTLFELKYGPEKAYDYLKMCTKYMVSFERVNLDKQEKDLYKERK